MKDNNKLISNGNAGEYYVAAELERWGFSVAVPMSNVPTFDLLAIDRNNYNHQIAIQVKTNGNSNKSEWMLSKKDELRHEKNFFYIFVKFYNNEAPSYHIVPADIVSTTIHNNHTAWLNTPGKNGQQHQDQNMRKFIDKDNKYKDRWDLLRN